MKNTARKSRFDLSTFFMIHFFFAVGLYGQAKENTFAPIEVKAVVVTMYEKGDAQGDDAGELQRWVERSKIKEVFDFPMGEFPLFLTEDNVLLTCTGGGVPNATASIMALGLDNRFDLSKAYWLVAGIAGGDPNDHSLGSAAWATVVIDGDLAYEIDAREIPKDWPYGYLPLGAKRPAEKPEDIYTGLTLNTIVYQLNSGLSNWAYDKTKNLSLTAGEATSQFRELFTTLPNAQKPPFITMGETLSSSTYWHGKLLNQWANDWVKLYGGETKNFMTTNMEDSGTLTALHRLARTDLVDTDKIMVLRTVSNYSMPPQGEQASWSTTAPYPEGGKPALESAYTVGSRVIEEIVSNWVIMKDNIPNKR